MDRWYFKEKKLKLITTFKVYMGIRKTSFVEEEHYHVYNRGVEKRDIFADKDDVRRFLKYLRVLNTVEPIGSLHQLSFKENLESEEYQLRGKTSKLVDIVCFALLPNHFHLLLCQREENGIPLFMQRLGTAHAMFFNEKYNRTGSLFQGKYKSIHVDTNEYLLRLSAYINLNQKVHGKWSKKKERELMYSSWFEYTGRNSKTSLCKKDIVLNQFPDKKSYAHFANQALKDTLVKRDKGENKELVSHLLE